MKNKEKIEKKKNRKKEENFKESEENSEELEKEENSEELEKEENSEELEKEENSEELEKEDIPEEIISNSIEEIIDFRNRFSPVLESIAEEQEIGWTRREIEQEKEEELRNYSNGLDLDNSKYEELPKEFFRDSSVNFNRDIEIAGKDFEIENFGLDKKNLRLEMEDRTSSNVEDDYFIPERFEQRESKIFSEERNKYRKFKIGK